MHSLKKTNIDPAESGLETTFLVSKGETNR
jgi:hypothetical protein